MFITLTELSSKKVIIPIQNIRYITEYGQNNEHSLILLSDDKKLYIKESILEIADVAKRQIGNNNNMRLQIYYDKTLFPK